MKIAEAYELRWKYSRVRQGRKTEQREFVYIVISWLLPFLATGAAPYVFYSFSIGT
jgi:hypothetical protein